MNDRTYGHHLLISRVACTCLPAIAPISGQPRDKVSAIDFWKVKKYVGTAKSGAVLRTVRFYGSGD